jgi:hypothetical protein
MAELAITKFPDFTTMLIQNRNATTFGVTKSMFSTLVRFTFFLLGLLVVASGCADQKTPALVSANTTMRSRSDDETSETKIANWYNLKRKSPMTSLKSYAVCRSIPHPAGNVPAASMSIWIQRSAGLSEVMLSGSPGCNLLSGAVEESSLLIRFDHENPVAFQFRPADDGSKNVIFIVDGNRFIQRLKNAQHIKIDAPCNGGKHHANFRVKGLIWDYGWQGNGKDAMNLISTVYNGTASRLRLGHNFE